MYVQLAYWQPWHTAVIKRHSLQEQVDLATELGVDAVAIKAVRWRDKLYGAKENYSDLSLYKAHSNDDFEQLAKKQGLRVDQWNWVDCQDPARDARLMREANYRWSPFHVDVDFEGDVAKAYSHNVGAFLRTMGPLFRHDGMPVGLWLQSYRVPESHDWVPWDKWLTYTDEQGAYIIDGISPQMYYIGTQDSVGDFKRSVDQYAAMARRLGRTFKWKPTLPVFFEHNWMPTAESLKEGIDYLVAVLGDDLFGIQLWRAAFLFEDRFSEIRAMLADYEWHDDDSEPPPDEPPQPPSPDPTTSIIVQDDLPAGTYDVYPHGGFLG